MSDWPEDRIKRVAAERDEWKARALAAEARLPEELVRKQGHSALRVRDGELEVYDPHPPADVKAAAVAWERSYQVQPVLPPNAYEGFLAGAAWATPSPPRLIEK
jgi:hypothetical protein